MAPSCVALLLPPVGAFIGFMVSWLTTPNHPALSVIVGYGILGATIVTHYALIAAVLWLPFHFSNHRHWAFAIIVGAAPHLVMLALYLAQHPGAKPPLTVETLAFKCVAGLVIAVSMWWSAYWNLPTAQSLYSRKE